MIASFTFSVALYLFAYSIISSLVDGNRLLKENGLTFIYILDKVVGFIYNNSRYYDPEIGRFINADGYISTGQGIVGNNMFAYCGNNPVNRVDPIGQFWSEIIEFVKMQLI